MQTFTYDKSVFTSVAAHGSHALIAALDAGAEHCRWEMERKLKAGVDAAFHARICTLLEVMAAAAGKSQENDLAHTQKGRERGPGNTQD